jgi:hypothetical protein
MYYVRILAQLIVAIFVIMATATEFGYARYPPQYFVYAAFVATMFLVSKRTTWLPFLGPAAVPVGILKESNPPQDADFSITIDVPKCAIRVMYWGSIVKSKNPVTAYGGYTNAGIADVSQGKATLVLKKPTSYSVRGFELKPHVHYRWITARGLLSSVHTAPVV